MLTDFEEKELEEISAKEGVSVERLKRLLSAGRVVIPRNARRRSVVLKAIGDMMSTKVNVNVGTSKDYVNVDEEVEKAKVAVRFGADTVMDLSTGGDLDEVRRRVLRELRVPVGTVPIYQAALSCGGAIVEMSPDDMFNAIERHARDGVDFMTVHAGVTLSAVERLKMSDRILNVVSRGGAFLVAWMLHNERENPLYEDFEYLIEIAKEYEVTLSLGDGLRPGCISDASDRAKYMEVITLGELVKKCREAGVQAIVEGPGHVPADEIEACVKTIKNLTDFAPLYLLGPLPTDIAPGYDHVVAAIGGAIAAMQGADFLCMVSPSEHLALPSIEDIREGTTVTKIAAHIADTVRRGQRTRAREKDRAMAFARKMLDWETQFNIAIDSERARKIKEGRPSESDACSICGDLCAIKIVNAFLNKFNK